MESDAREERPDDVDADLTTQHPSGAGMSHAALIGPFRVVALIGEGAMGIVYEAEQQRPRRRVALKIIRPGLSTPAMLRRFEHEYEFLGRPSASYQIRKFTHRHKGLVGGAIAVLLALVAGVIVSTWQAVRASRAERVAQARANEAQSEKAKAEAVTKFLTEMLGSVDPSQARGREVTVRTALDDAAQKIDSGAMRAQPEVEVAVRNAIGTTYEGLGVFEAAEGQLRAALDLESRSARNPVVLADTNARLVNVLYKRQKFAEAQPVAEAAVKLRQEVLGPRHVDTATSLDDLGAILLQNGDVPGAEAKMREALAIRRDVLGPDDPQLSTRRPARRKPASRTSSI